MAASVRAQDERPLIVPTADRRAPAKKDLGPRAVAVVETTAKGKSALLPIAILIDGKFWDATAYKADPVPMALEAGTVYEVERDGRSTGLFTVSGALHSNAANAETPWLGTGVMSAVGSDVGKKTVQANPIPVGIDSSDEPPRLTKKGSAPGSSGSPGSTPPSGTASPSGTPPTASSPSTNPPPSSSSGDEPPRLTRGTPDSSQPSPPPSSQAGDKSTEAKTSPDSAPSSPPKTDSKPPDQKTEQKSADSKPAAPSIPASDSDTPESARPILRRGKPTSPLPEDEEVPGYTKVSASGSLTSTVKSATKGSTPSSAATADRTPVEIIPAISDAGGPEPRSFAYQWLQGDEADRRKQMVDLAKQHVIAYLAAQAKATTTSPQTTHHSTAAKPAATKTKDPILDEVQMKTFDPWVSNQPVIVFSAQAHMPPPAASAAHWQAESQAVPQPIVYSVLIVAFPDIYNNMHTLYAGVTDRFHLDVAPRLDLIDAVDADGDGRGEFLFRKTSDGGAGWVIYRPTADKLYKMFDSLNPE